jgi:hypothetical protein
VSPAFAFPIASPVATAQLNPTLKPTSSPAIKRSPTKKRKP